MKKITALLLVAMIALPLGIFSKEKAPTEEELAAAHARLNGQANAFLARELGIPLAAVEHARGRDYPFGHALFFAVVAKMAKAKMKDVVDVADTGLDGGEICAAFGLDPIKVIAEKKRIFKLLRDSGPGIPYPSEKEWHKLLSVHPEKR